MISKGKAEVVTVGIAEFPRYIIVAGSSEQRRYWAGQKWISQSHLALLYANRKAASDDLASISQRTRRS
jgi:hypothetical protein